MIFIAIGVLAVVFHLLLHFTNPYAKFSQVRQPYITKVVGGKITVKKRFAVRVYGGALASILGYYKSGFLIVQNAWFGSYKADSRDADGVIADIHKKVNRICFIKTHHFLIWHAARKLIINIWFQGCCCK